MTNLSFGTSKYVLLFISPFFYLEFVFKHKALLNPSVKENET